MLLGGYIQKKSTKFSYLIFAFPQEDKDRRVAE
jgi:hypothetical protein